MTTTSIGKVKYLFGLHSLLASVSLNEDAVFQTCHPAQRLGQDTDEEPLTNRERMADYWSSAKPRLATLRHSSVSVAAFPCVTRLAHDNTLRCRPEPHILLFRRPLGTDPQSGRVDPELAATARNEYKNQFVLRK